jgi:hypothetical protein
MEELQKLYNVLVRDGYYTQGIDEFTVQIQDPAYVDKVYGVVTRDGLYTKDRQAFESQYGLKKKKMRNCHRRLVLWSNKNLLMFKKKLLLPSSLKL